MSARSDLDMSQMAILTGPGARRRCRRKTVRHRLEVRLSIVDSIVIGSITREPTGVDGGGDGRDLTK